MYFAIDSAYAQKQLQTTQNALMQLERCIEGINQKRRLPGFEHTDYLQLLNRSLDVLAPTNWQQQAFIFLEQEDPLLFTTHLSSIDTPLDPSTLQTQLQNCFTLMSQKLHTQCFLLPAWQADTHGQFHSWAHYTSTPSGASYQQALQKCVYQIENALPLQFCARWQWHSSIYTQLRNNLNTLLSQHKQPSFELEQLLCQQTFSALNNCPLQEASCLKRLEQFTSYYIKAKWFDWL